VALSLPEERSRRASSASGLKTGIRSRRRAGPDPRPSPSGV